MPRRVRRALRERPRCSRRRRAPRPAKELLGHGPLNRSGVRRRHHASKAHAQGQQVAHRDRPLRGHGLVERPVEPLRTLRSASSGSSRSTDSSSRTLHSSTRIIAAAAVIGFVSSALVVLVMAAEPPAALIATQRCPVEPLVHPPEDVRAAGVGEVRLSSKNKCPTLLEAAAGERWPPDPGPRER